MSKFNPLFVDSTKFQGDMIVTLIELADLENAPGLEVEAHFELWDGSSQVVALQFMETKWCGQIHLQHQKEISFLFVIRQDGTELAKTEPVTARATYLIQESMQGEVEIEIPQILTEAVDDEILDSEAIEIEEPRQDVSESLADNKISAEDDDFGAEILANAVMNSKSLASATTVEENDSIPIEPSPEDKEIAEAESKLVDFNKMFTPDRFL